MTVVLYKSCLNGNYSALIEIISKRSFLPIERSSQYVMLALQIISPSMNEIRQH